MGDNVGTCIPTIEAQAERQLLQTGWLAQEREGGGNLKVDGFIAVVESRTFLGECISHSARLALPLPIITYSTVFELEQQHSPASPEIVIVSLTEAGSEAVINTLTNCRNFFPESRSSFLLTRLTHS
jgi:hypothetical protein